MKSFLILFLASLMSFSVLAQKPYTISKDDQTGSLIFKGLITLSDLQNEPSFKWMNSSYKPDATAVASLKQSLPSYSIIAFIGTWCDDSQSLMPKLARVLQDTNFPASNFTLWGVDRTKETAGGESKIYQVKKVPTIIILKDNKEVGRIVEAVSSSIEEDLLQIIQKG
jgi:thiol-disulfide isomerase/thioredoxin